MLLAQIIKYFFKLVLKKSFPVTKLHLSMFYFFYALGMLLFIIISQ